MQMSESYTVRSFIFFVEDKHFNKILKLLKNTNLLIFSALSKSVHDIAELGHFMKAQGKSTE